VQQSEQTRRAGWTNGDQPVPAGRWHAVESAEAGDDLVLFDREQMHYHTLNAGAAEVWRLCDGRRTVTDIARETAKADLPLDHEAVALAVAELGEAGLLEAEPEPETWQVGWHRRRFLKVAAAGIMVPAVASISVPQPAAGQTLGTSCGNLGEECCDPGDTCAPPLICNGVICVEPPPPCGGLNELCCGGTTCTAPGTACLSGTCQLCGLAGQPCCPGTGCAAGNNCVGNLCTPCGDLQELCCDNGVTCNSSLTCCNGACRGGTDLGNNFTCNSNADCCTGCCHRIQKHCVDNSGGANGGACMA
jgi:hypothetical protein